MKPKPTILRCLSLVLLFPLVLAQISTSGHGAPGPRPAPKTGRTEYVFKDDVLVELRRDTDGNGRLDDWRTFDRGYLVHLELDFDGDGEPDWRESWKRPDSPTVAYELKFIEGRWRILPYAYYIEGNNQHIAREGINNVLFNYTGHAEKLIEGRWTDTFEDSFGYSYQTFRATDGPGRVAQWKSSRSRPLG
jgi:hypothetical protein